VDTLLSETGVQQGEAVGQYLKDITFNKVFVSNLQRAVQVRQKHTIYLFIFLNAGWGITIFCVTEADDRCHLRQISWSCKKNLFSHVIMFVPANEEVKL